MSIEGNLEPARKSAPSEAARQKAIESMEKLTEQYAQVKAEISFTSLNRTFP